MTDNDERRAAFDAADPDIDDIPWQELGEFDEMYEAVHTALREHHELMRHSTLTHGVGTFLSVLANLGYCVAKIEQTPISDLLPAPQD